MRKCQYGQGVVEVTKWGHQIRHCLILKGNPENDLDQLSKWQIKMKSNERKTTAMFWTCQVGTGISLCRKNGS